MSDRMWSLDEIVAWNDWLQNQPGWAPWTMSSSATTMDTISWKHAIELEATAQKPPDEQPNHNGIVIATSGHTRTGASEILPDAQPEAPR
ncbi:hypothetical protein IFR05_002445 [Cadophora sp. M221]|nr:hypothetical protein IFR05_002445 [Cadophora sp. M221]